MTLQAIGPPSWRYPHETTRPCCTLRGQLIKDHDQELLKVDLLEGVWSPKTHLQIQFQKLFGAGMVFLPTKWKTFFPTEMLLEIELHVVIKIQPTRPGR